MKKMVNKTNTTIKKNFIFNTVNQVLTIIIPLITTPYLTRILGASGLGVFSYEYSIVYYFGIFTTLGLTNYGNRSIAKVKDSINDRSRTFCEIYAFQIFMCLLMSCMYAVFILFFSKNKYIGIIMMLYVVASGLDINWFYYGMELFKLTTIRNVVVKVISVVAIFALVKNQTDVWLYCLVYVISQLMSQIILWITIKKYIHFCPVNLEHIKKHIKPNFMLFIPVVAVSLYKIMDKIMLGAMISETEVGFYESSERIILVPVALINSLGIVMLPRISNLISKNKVKESTVYFEKSISFVMFLATSMGFGIMGISREFVPLFYGDGFEKCIYIFQVILPSCLFLAFANVVRTQFLIPNNMDKDYTISIIMGAMVNLVANVVLIPRFESVGAGIGTLLAEATVCVIQCFCIRKQDFFIPCVKRAVPYLISGIVMYLILINISFENCMPIAALVIKVLIGAVIYCVATIIQIPIMKKMRIKLF